MRAILIKPKGLVCPWTDTGVRTMTPEREVSAHRRRNPQCLVIAVAEADVPKMTGAGRG